jgi:hypothetical protein
MPINGARTINPGLEGTKDNFVLPSLEQKVHLAHSLNTLYSMNEKISAFHG